MDLSQQELPLTSYFTRASRDSNPRVNPRKRNKYPDEDLSFPSKRKESSSKPGLRPTTLQLPTPAASARKRIRGETQLDQIDVLSPAEPTAGEKRSAQLAFGSCPGTIDTGPSNTSLATPPTDRRMATDPIERELFPTPQLTVHLATGIATPQTSSRRLSRPVPRIDSSPLAHSNCPLLSDQNGVSSPQDSVQRTNNQPSKGLPRFPVSSSQSQYLLPVDATPKRKQRTRRIEHVISSQTQEERELTLSSSLGPITMFSLSAKHSRKNTLPGDGQSLCLSPSRRKRQSLQVLDCSPVGSSLNTPSRSSRSLAKKKSDELPYESLATPRRKVSTPYHSSSRETRTPRRLTHQDSVAPSAHIDDSLTESESDPDCAQAPSHPPVSQDGCPPMRREFVRDNLPVTEDGSATEAESDTEMLRCVAEIGNKRRERRPEVSREEAPPLPVISPLVSPARPRIAPMLTQLSMRPGAKSSASGSSTPYQPNTEQLCVRSDSLPSVVQDFIRMFPGDESYPADFPESLRV